MVSFPSWWAPKDGPPQRFISDADVPKYWHHVPGDYDAQTGQWIDAEPEDAPLSRKELMQALAARKTRFKMTMKTDELQALLDNSEQAEPSE